MVTDNVLPAGIEPTLPAPQAGVLSVERQERSEEQDALNHISLPEAFFPLSTDDGVESQVQ